LNPQEFVINTTAGTPSYNVKSLVPCGYIAQFFYYWKGSIGIRFKIVKTQFHSGRLVVSFNPNPNAASSITLDDTQYLHRHILDIRDDCEYEIVFPYVTTYSWTQYDQHYGRVYMHVLNDLVCPDTVSSTIAILCEAYMADDAQFAVPRNVKVCPWTPYVAEPLDMVPEAQMNGSEEVVTKVITPIGNSSYTDDDKVLPAFTIGEDVTSVAQMCKRLNPLVWISGPPSATTFQYKVFSFYGCGSVTVPSLQVSSFFDIISAFGSMYALNRGSMVIQLDKGSAARMEVAAIADSVNTLYSTPTIDNFSLSGSNVIMYSPDEQGQAIFQIPSYNRLHSRLNSFSYLGADTYPIDKYHSHMNLYYIADAAIIPRMYRAIGDDFQFGMFVACPPVVVLP
jgi:hypothetical protein